MSNNTNPIQSLLDYTLRQFCAYDVFNDEFKYQLAPFTCDGYSVASNSRVLLAIDNTLFPTLPGYPFHGTPLVTKLNKAIATAKEFEAYAVDDLETVCNECAELNTKAKDDYANAIYLAPDAFSVNVMRQVILAARLLGASSIFVPVADQVGQQRYFLTQDLTGRNIAMGIFMPMLLDNQNHIRPVPQALTLPDTATIDLDAGMQFRIEKEAAEEQARKEHEAAKKVWRVQVVKVGCIAVEATTVEEAMSLAADHTGSVDDDVFEDSDVSVESAESYPMDDDDIEDMSSAYTNKRQGILTEEGFIPWSKYYGEDDKDDEFHKDRTRVSVSFGK